MSARDRAVGRVATELGDLLAVAGVATVAGAAILAGVVDGPLRVVIAAVLLGICPGYAVVSALFPRTTPLPWRNERHSRWGHRAALGVATSLLVLVLAGVVLSPTEFAPSTLVGTVLAITAVGCLVAAVRRLRVPESERPRLPLDRLVEGARDATTRAPRADAALNVALAVAVVVGLGTLAVGLAAPDRGEAYSEVALVTADGEQSAIGNDTYAPGEEATLTLEVENQDNTERSYTVVVVLERFADPPDGGETATLPPLLEREELSRTTLTLGDGETTTRPMTFTPSLIGDDLRLSLYIYVGDAPATASPTDADYHLYRWVDVTADGGNGTAAVAPIEVGRQPAPVGG